ncbi:DNA-3-methyladenine glycosylase isoform X4 [Nasonia vitripennis]|uniref:DNA-3-methyladenine glycosylase n=1 Tax=Nasonia vitripennis TaxID=7425 RepID=A0A7M7QUS0_NASVI|nr:DNA-3-methyladenine glycosylase isoform X4 [Nasonia vitripennis]XP_032454058.1 DNA-3-methyladenine glycosylase isoform X4 [Nasonia vitripennis]
MKRTRASTRIKKLNEQNESESPAALEKENEEKNKNEKAPKKVVKKIAAKTVEDLESIKDELQQLNDPPSTPWEKEIRKILVRKLDDGTILKGRIVETESYLGIVDKASATYQGKVTLRNIPMYMDPGTIFVYLTYGMYHCFNISSGGEGSSVFLRAVEPLEGIDKMKENRNFKSSSKAPKKACKDFKVHDLCNGPSKLCMALDIKKGHTKYSMCSWKGMWIEEDPKKEEIKIVNCSRIGIDSAGVEWASKPLRFYILGNESVSKRDKKAESSFL